jgi:uncharacterized protein (TIGR02594 family)
MITEPAWLIAARELIGLAEIPGVKHAPEIVQLWKDAGLSFKDDETPWCAGFVGGCLKRGGVKPSGSAAARSYTRWGFDVLDLGVTEIPLGAVVVYSRGANVAQGHVGFAVGLTPDGKILTLGGNQGNKVSVKPFEPERLVAARWPTEAKNDIRVLVNIPKTDNNDSVSTREE